MPSPSVLSALPIILIQFTHSPPRWLATSSPHSICTVPVSGFGIPYASVVTRAHTVSPLLQYKTVQRRTASDAVCVFRRVAGRPWDPTVGAQAPGIIPGHLHESTGYGPRYAAHTTLFCATRKGTGKSDVLIGAARASLRTVTAVCVGTAGTALTAGAWGVVVAGQAHVSCPWQPHK